MSAEISEAELQDMAVALAKAVPKYPPEQLKARIRTAIEFVDREGLTDAALLQLSDILLPGYVFESEDMDLVRNFGQKIYERLSSARQGGCP